jgi:hypothetical protein
MAGFMLEPCGTCYRLIIWAVTTRGKDMPVNPDPVPGGNIALDERPGVAPLARVLTVTQQFGRTNLRTSHFVDCPQAPKWRKRGRS